MKKRALVLSGGGGKGAFQVGLVLELLKHGIDFDFVSGVSIGAINATVIAQERYDLLEKFWLDIKSFNDVFTTNYIRFFISLFHNSKIQPIFKLKVSEQIRSIVESNLIKKELKIGVTDLLTGEYLVIDKNQENFCDYLFASSAIPLLFSPVEKNSLLLVDGGVRNNTPLKEAVRYGAEEIYIVLLSPVGVSHISSKDLLSPISLFARVTDIISNEFQRNDINLFLSRNKDPKYRKIDLKICQPEIGLGDFLDFSSSSIKSRIEHGRVIARKLINQ